ncbi:helix-turn-helix domain-containing protein [Pseudooceanicola sp. GBMRC 2024]|uniref:Helix-turn-helix domain-containing protein n=2 Tax=Paracoccaceae TaxID=31989 RepID=A0A6L7G5C6_9RHOB|nr:helix-turn-helix domain-containing protein [Pseudooceanicola albus]
MIDLGGPMQAFASCNAEAGQELYRLVTASARGGPLRTGPGLMVETVAADTLDPAAIGTLIVPGGSTTGRPPQDRPLSAWLAAHGPRVGRLCSVCTGAFLLGAAGLLSGRRAVTHWRWSGELQRRCPEARIELDPIFIEDHGLWTSAGVSSGIDLALALITRDHGRAMAMAVARTLVVYVTRDGGQAQFSVPLEAQSRADDSFAALDSWIMAHLGARLDLETLAARAGMSERTFRRRYRAATGRSPAQAVEAFRLEAAAQALASGPLSLKDIARQVGCDGESALLRLFRRHYGVTPSEYRRRFAQTTSTG